MGPWKDVFNELSVNSDLANIFMTSLKNPFDIECEMVMWPVVLGNISSELSSFQWFLSPGTKIFQKEQSVLLTQRKNKKPEVPIVHSVSILFSGFYFWYSYSYLLGFHPSPRYREGARGQQRSALRPFLTSALGLRPFLTSPLSAQTLSFRSALHPFAISAQRSYLILDRRSALKTFISFQRSALKAIFQNRSALKEPPAPPPKRRW